MKNRKQLSAVFAVTVCIIAAVAAMLFSYAKFNSINLPKIVYAITAVSTGNEDYVVIRGNYKKVIIADPSDPDAFYKYIESNGYVELDDQQMGSIHVIEKNGEKEVVELSVNGHYRLWLWQE